MEDSILLGLARSLGYVALLTMGYSLVVSHFPTGLKKSAATGALFAVAGLVSMSDPIHLADGVIYDARTPVLALAASYGGLVGAAVAAIPMILYRMMLGGLGAGPGIVGIAVAALIGAAFVRISGRTRYRRWVRHASLGFIASSSVVTIVWLPWEISGPIILNDLPSIILANVAGVLILGTFLDREKERLRMSRALEQEAATDPLTQLSNRRFFEERALPILRRSETVNQQASMVMVDIDHFKLINDRWGHHVGDRVLVEVASIVRRSVRATDIVARFGGEEIVILMPATSLEIADQIADRLREQISNAGFADIDGELRVTLSAGVAATSANLRDLHGLLKAADGALYRAKAEGRNRVVIAA